MTGVITCNYPYFRKPPEIPPLHRNQWGDFPRTHNWLRRSQSVDRDRFETRGTAGPNFCGQLHRLVAITCEFPAISENQQSHERATEALLMIHDPSPWVDTGLAQTLEHEAWNKACSPIWKKQTSGLDGFGILIRIVQHCRYASIVGQYGPMVYCRCSFKQKETSEFWPTRW